MRLGGEVGGDDSSNPFRQPFYFGSKNGGGGGVPFDPYHRPLRFAGTNGGGVSSKSKHRQALCGGKNALDASNDSAKPKCRPLLLFGKESDDSDSSKSTY